MKTEITVGLADDHPLVRRGLRSVIELEKNLRVTWEADNGNEVLEKIAAAAPDVVILDINMPQMDGIKTARALKADFPDVKLIFLSMHKDVQIFDSMKNFGVKGYVVKDSAIDEIVECINRVAGDETYLSPALRDLLYASETPARDGDKEQLYVLENLTNAEKQIIALIARSKTSREIADALFVSVRTVENHRLNISKKLNLRGNHALVKFALEHKNDIARID